MNLTKILSTLMFVAILAIMSGCVMFNKPTLSSTKTTTIGKELIDLKKARDKKIISQKEYEDTKKEIMEGGPIKIETWMNDDEKKRKHKRKCK